jgi:hypothetical protein
MAPNPLSVYDALTGKRLRITGLPQGAQLCSPILGYWHRATGITVYVAGTMAPQLRTAAEQGCEAEEVLFADLSAGLREIELEDCRYELKLLLPPARVLPLVPPDSDEASADALAA